MYSMTSAARRRIGRECVGDRKPATSGGNPNNDRVSDGGGPIEDTPEQILQCRCSDFFFRRRAPSARTCSPSAASRFHTFPSCSILPTAAMEFWGMFLFLKPLISVFANAFVRSPHLLLLSGSGPSLATCWHPYVGVSTRARGGTFVFRMQFFRCRSCRGFKHGYEFVGCGDFVRIGVCVCGCGDWCISLLRSARNFHIGLMFTWF